MKSYMDLCEDCDRLTQYPDTCYKFLIEGYSGVFGHLIEPIVRSFTWNEHWDVNHDQKTVRLLGGSFDTRKERLDNILISERDKGTFKVLKKWTGERFPIYGPNRQLIVDIERAAAGLFGIVTYGIQFLPARETQFECVVRESHEEAGLTPELVNGQAKSVGTISYVTASDIKNTSGGKAGLIRAEVQYVYDLKVDADVVPKPYDMEASSIDLYSIDQIKKALDDGDFTPANACLMLDFFIRHGLTTFDNEENYTQIISRLHRPLGMHTA